MAKDRLQECEGIIKHAEKQGTADFASRISMQSMRNHERELLQARIQELEGEVERVNQQTKFDKAWSRIKIFSKKYSHYYEQESRTRIQELEAELAKYKLKYTKDKPTEPGWYWWGKHVWVNNRRVLKGDIYKMVQVNDYPAFQDQPLNKIHKNDYFAGPIPEPGQED